MTQRTIEIISNPEIIAINQDSLGSPAMRYISFESIHVFKGQLSGREYVVAVVNGAHEMRNINVSLSRIFVDEGVTVFSQTFEARDLWANSHISQVIQGYISVELRPHATRAFKLTPRGHDVDFVVVDQQDETEAEVKYGRENEAFANWALTPSLQLVFGVVLIGVVLMWLRCSKRTVTRIGGIEMRSKM